MGIKSILNKKVSLERDRLVLKAKFTKLRSTEIADIIEWKLILTKKIIWTRKKRNYLIWKFL